MHFYFDFSACDSTGLFKDVQAYLAEYRQNYRKSNTNYIDRKLATD